MHTPGFCAIIVAGGKSSRLGNTPKAGLSNGTHTLLDRALLAVSQADACVVVGPETLPVPNDVLLTREDPPYSGPAAAIHAVTDAPETGFVPGGGPRMLGKQTYRRGDIGGVYPQDDAPGGGRAADP